MGISSTRTPCLPLPLVCCLRWGRRRSFISPFFITHVDLLHDVLVLLRLDRSLVSPFHARRHLALHDLQEILQVHLLFSNFLATVPLFPNRAKKRHDCKRNETHQSACSSFIFRIVTQHESTPYCRLVLFAQTRRSDDTASSRLGRAFFFFFFVCQASTAQHLSGWFLRAKKT